MNKNVRITEERILSDNWYTLKDITFEYRTQDGKWRTQKRETYDRGNGATILLYNKEQKKVILTQQFRVPTYVNGHETGLLIEACAGVLDGDSPEECARREAEEETGYRVTELKKVFEAYMSPGAVTEKVYFFVAPYSQEMRISEGGGLEAESEDIKVLEVDFKESLQMIRDGRIQDGKTIMLLQYAQLEGILN